MTLKTNGFTLIELIIVIGLILVLALAGFMDIKVLWSHKKINFVKANLSIILETLERYREKTKDYPKDQEEFDGFLENQEWFKEVPKNPYWDNSSTQTKHGWLYLRNDGTTQVEIEVYAIGTQ